MSSEDTFREDWGFPSEVKASIPGAAFYGTEMVPGTYKSGRPKFETTFLSKDRKVLARRPAMELISKKTKRPYIVCRRAEDSWNAARPAAARSAYTLDDAIA